MTFTIDENIIFFSNIHLNTFIINYTTILIYLCINIVICYNSTYLKYKILFLKQFNQNNLRVYIYILAERWPLFHQKIHTAMRTHGIRKTEWPIAAINLRHRVN